MRERLKASTPKSEKLSKCEPILRELSGVTGVSNEYISRIISDENLLDTTIERYLEMKKKSVTFPVGLEGDGEAWKRGYRIPTRFVAASKADFRPEIWDRCMAAPDGLYLTGKAGTGKTHLAVALLKHEAMTPPEIMFNADSGHFTLALHSKPRFISVPDLLMSIRTSFKPDSTVREHDVILPYLTSDMIVMDDLGAEKTSDWSIQTLYTVFDQRYREMKKTIITSNLSLDEIASRIGDRIASRIAGMCRVFTLTGKDRRISMP